jgi:hypothetical protein
MLHKVNKKLDVLLEILLYYEKVKEIISEVTNGPAKVYFDIAQNIFTTVLPLLTNKRKSK